MKPNFAHTDTLIASSASWLQNAMVAGVSEDIQIGCAFVAGYNTLQSVQPAYEGPLGDHPLACIVENGAAIVGLSEADKDLGQQLRDWEDYGRYQLQPPPVSLAEAIEWAQRVRDAAIKLLATP